MITEVIWTSGATEQSSEAYGRKKVRQFALLSLPGALFDFGRYIFESIPSPDGDFVAWTTLGGLAIVISFCAMWWLGLPFIRICSLYFWLIARGVWIDDREILKQAWLVASDRSLRTLPHRLSLVARSVWMNDRELPKKAWLAASDRSLWTLPYTATICSLAWIGYSLTQYGYLDMPMGISHEFFFGLMAYGAGAWSVVVLLRTLYRTFRRAVAPAKFIEVKMQCAAVALGFVVAANFAFVFSFARIAADDWASIFPFGIGTSMPAISRSVRWFFPESSLVILLVAGTVWFLVVKVRTERLIPVEMWILSIVSLATSICLYSLVMPHLSGMHGMANAFGDTVLRKEGPTHWIDEVIWIVISIAAIIWSVRKRRR